MNRYIPIVCIALSLLVGCVGEVVDQKDTNAIDMTEGTDTNKADADASNTDAKDMVSTPDDMGEVDTSADIDMGNPDVADTAEPDLTPPDMTEPVDMGPQLDECSTDDHCRLSQFCENGKCLNDPNQPLAQCIQDSECRSNTCSGSFCDNCTDASCGDRGVCNDGTGFCEEVGAPAGHGCQNNGECASGVCMSDGYCGCVTGNECRSGTCNAVGRCECTTNADCPTTTKCSASSQCVECVTDSDCAPNELCTNKGACVPR